MFTPAHRPRGNLFVVRLLSSSNRRSVSRRGGLRQRVETPRAAVNKRAEENAGRPAAGTRIHSVNIPLEKKSEDCKRSWAERSGWRCVYGRLARATLTFQALCGFKGLAYFAYFVVQKSSREKLFFCSPRGECFRSCAGAADTGRVPIWTQNLKILCWDS